MDKQDFPSPLRAWAVVILLLLAYIMSYMDRSIFGILLDPIKADFNFTDTQMGLLGGIAFAVLYAGFGIPLGWLADRFSRRNIVIFGIAVWSLATAATGVARNFMGLFLARMMTGAGEATLSPCAMSMISDLFPKHTRGRAIAVYSSAISIGIGLGSLAIAALIKYAHGIDFTEMATYGIDKPWRFVFVVISLPGLLIALLFLLVREPKRHGVMTQSTLGDFVNVPAHIFKHRGAFFGIFGLGCIMSICTYYSYTWNPAYYTRTFAWPVSEYLKYTGLAILLIGPASMFAAGFLIDHLTKKGLTDAPILVMKLGLAIIVPVFVIYPLMPTYMSAFIVFQFSTFGFTMATAAGPAALLAISPPRMKAQIMAYYYMAISLTGLLIGPLVVGLLNDKVFRDPNMIAKSLLYVALALIVPTVYFLARSAKPFSEKVDTLDALEKAV